MIFNLRRFEGLGLLLPLLATACGLVGNGDDAVLDGIQGEKAYETHVVCKGDTLRELDQDLLRNFDSIILGAQNFPHLEARFKDRALLYFNPWGKSRYSDDLDWIDWTVYQPSPEALGEDDIVLGGGVHCYRFDDAHVERFLGWIEHYLADNAGGVKGVFLDDFGPHRNWWGGWDHLKDAVWGPMDGRPGWREDPEGWNVQRIEAIEAGALDLVREYCGADGVVLVNGIARSLAGVRRFAEDAGRPCCENWDILESGVEDIRYALPGDYLQVNGMGASGQWGDWAESAAGNGRENLERAAALAAQRGLSVGLAYGTTPAQGGTIYQLYIDPADPEGLWPGYYAQP